MGSLLYGSEQTKWVTSSMKPWRTEQWRQNWSKKQQYSPPCVLTLQKWLMPLMIPEGLMSQWQAAPNFTGTLNRDIGNVNALHLILLVRVSFQYDASAKWAPRLPCVLGTNCQKYSVDTLIHWCSLPPCKKSWARPSFEFSNCSSFKYCFIEMLLTICCSCH